MSAADTPSLHIPIETQYTYPFQLEGKVGGGEEMTTALHFLSSS